MTWEMCPGSHEMPARVLVEPLSRPARGIMRPGRGVCAVCGRAVALSASTTNTCWGHYREVDE